MSRFKKMEERKWEEMNVDCLANIFGRVELQSRVQAIPLVCKTWYKALLNPSCWEQLMFPLMIPSRQTTHTELIKFVVNRSQKRATLLALPFSCDREVLVHFSEELPGLKTLALSSHLCLVHHDIIPSLIIKWKNLKGLMLGDSTFVEQILEPIPIHLPEFAVLCFGYCKVDSKAALAIVSHVPKLKALVMMEAIVKKEDLILIMQGCKQLVHLDVRNCIGFDEDDEDILRFSSGIKHFQCQGTKEMNELYQQMESRLRVTAAEALAIDTGTDVDNNVFEAIDGEDEYEWDQDEDWL